MCFYVPWWPLFLVIAVWWPVSFCQWLVGRLSIKSKTEWLGRTRQLALQQKETREELNTLRQCFSSFPAFQLRIVFEFTLCKFYILLHRMQAIVDGPAERGSTFLLRFQEPFSFSATPLHVVWLAAAQPCLRCRAPGRRWWDTILLVKQVSLGVEVKKSSVFIL